MKFTQILEQLTEETYSYCKECDWKSDVKAGEKTVFKCPKCKANVRVGKKDKENFTDTKTFKDSQYFNKKK